METGDGSEFVISASSSYDPLNVGPQHARWVEYIIYEMLFILSFYFRLHHDDHGGAWCPLQPVSPDKSDQWLGINFTTSHVISMLETQGRFANGQGQEYAMAYRVLYWREGLTKFKEYRDSLGRMVRLKILKPKRLTLRISPDSARKQRHIHRGQKYSESSNHSLSHQNCSLQQPFQDCLPQSRRYRLLFRR